MKEVGIFSPSMSSSHHSEGHVLMPGLAIGSLALVLAAGFGFVGLLDRANHLVGRAVQLDQSAPLSLPDWAIWIAAAVGAFGVSFAILSVPGNWRRIVLWLSALILVIGWAPVLVLAAREPEIAVPLLATFWSGLCAFVYASRHHMAVDP